MAKTIHFEEHLYELQKKRRRRKRLLAFLGVCAALGFSAWGMWWLVAESDIFHGGEIYVSGNRGVSREEAIT
ncbi:MAG: hypothetical protein AAB967_01500, partial [Patescibacteria group bacterium]